MAFAAMSRRLDVPFVLIRTPPRRRFHLEFRAVDRVDRRPFAQVVHGPQAGIGLGVTLLDGLVLARSAFNHSLNYRSAMVFGVARPVPEADKAAALEAFMERLCPGRSGQARPGSAAELKQTAAQITASGLVDVIW